MIEKPLVSVIINCYNGEKYLREAIDSVIAQTYENWELVFWDNQSTDSTRQIVDSYNNPKIKYFYAPEHTPLGAARNLAVEKTNGEYINFLDADDLWAHNKLEEQLKLISPGRQEVVFTPLKVKVESDGRIDRRLYTDFKYLEKYSVIENNIIENLFLKGNFIEFSSILFNKKLYLEVGGIDPEFRQCEDLDIILKCGLKTTIGNAVNTYSVYRIHGGNNTTNSGLLGLYEKRKIYSTLPQSDIVKKETKRNETRIAMHLLTNERKVKEAFSLLYRKGCLILVADIIVKKIVRYFL